MSWVNYLGLSLLMEVYDGIIYSNSLRELFFIRGKKGDCDYCISLCMQKINNEMACPLALYCKDGVKTLLCTEVEYDVLNEIIKTKTVYRVYVEFIMAILCISFAVYTCFQFAYYLALKKGGEADVQIKLKRRKLIK